MEIQISKIKGDIWDTGVAVVGYKDLGEWNKATELEEHL
jgi:hypothetical protein